MRPTNFACFLNNASFIFGRAKVVYHLNLLHAIRNICFSFSQYLIAYAIWANGRVHERVFGQGNKPVFLDKLE